MRQKPILYISKDGKKVEALLFNVIQLSKEGDAFVGEDERYNPRTGDYDLLSISVKIDSLGEFKTKRVMTGWKRIIPERFFNGLRYVRKDLVKQLSDEEKLALRKISTTQIVNIIKKMNKDARKWSIFENAVYLIHDRTIRYFKEVRKKVYSDIPTGFVINAKINVWYKNREYSITKGTFVNKCDCNGKKVYRFVVPCAR